MYGFMIPKKNATTKKEEIILLVSSVVEILFPYWGTLHIRGCMKRGPKKDYSIGVWEGWAQDQGRA